MLTSRTTQWVAGTALLCVGLIAAAWLLLVAPRREEAAQLREENVSAQNQNDLLEVKIAQLKAQFAKLPESQAALADILAQMPPDAGVPKLVRDLDGIARSTGVRLGTVSPGSPQALTAAVSGTAGAGAAGSAAAPAGAAGAGTSVTESTVVAVPVSVVLTGDYFQTVAFLKQLQSQMPRAFLVSTIQMAASGDSNGSATSGRVQVTINGSVFSLPGMSADGLATGTGTGTSTGTTAGAAGTTTPAATPGASAGTTQSPAPSTAPSGAPGAPAASNGEIS